MCATHRHHHRSRYTLLRSLLGDFDFDELYTADSCVTWGWLTGPLLFAIYISYLRVAKPPNS